jgi:hypothetical protein
MEKWDDFLLGLFKYTVLIRLSHPMSEISHVGADFTAFILPDSLHDAEIRGAVPLSIGKKPSLLAGCDNRISTKYTTQL